MVMISISGLKVAYDGLKVKGTYSFPRKTTFVALEIDQLEVREGNVVAILGHNGAGKTTLLNALAGKLRPREGLIKTHGTNIHLSGVNPGFAPHLSPRQNLSWLSKIYDANPKQIISEVESFSELGEAFDRPVRTLSGGMRGRVGFGFATSLEPDILLIDEVLGVGDPSFKAKATNRLEKMMERTGIVLISTHSVGLVKSIATSALVLSKGKVVHNGNVDEGLNLYSSMK